MNYQMHFPFYLSGITFHALDASRSTNRRPRIYEFSYREM